MGSLGGCLRPKQGGFQILGARELHLFPRTDEQQVRPCPTQVVRSSRDRRKGAAKGRRAEERTRVVCLRVNRSSPPPSCATPGRLPNLSVPYFLICVSKANHKQNKYLRRSDRDPCACPAPRLPFHPLAATSRDSEQEVLSHASFWAPRRLLSPPWVASSVFLTLGNRWSEDSNINVDFEFLLLVR